MALLTRPLRTLLALGRLAARLLPSTTGPAVTDPEVARLVRQGDEAYRAGRREEARRAYREAYERRRGDLGALRGLRTLALDAGAWREALTLQQRLVALAPPAERAAERARDRAAEAERARSEAERRLTEVRGEVGAARAAIEHLPVEGLVERAVSAAEGALARPELPSLAALPEEPGALAEAAGALAEGLVDCVVSDHRALAPEEVQGELASCPFGAAGLQTLAACVLGELVHEGILEPLQAVRAVTWAPARLLGLPAGTLQEGARADLVVFDPGRRWVVEPHRWAAGGRNTPLAGRPMRGQVVATIAGGRLVMRDGELCG